MKKNIRNYNWMAKLKKKSIKGNKKNEDWNWKTKQNDDHAFYLK